MNTFTCFTLSTINKIAHLVLNRPEAMNTMHPLFWRELDAALSDLHKGTEARALVISSTGKHFSAGMALDTLNSAISMLIGRTDCNRLVLFPALNRLIGQMVDVRITEAGQRSLKGEVLVAELA